MATTQQSFTAPSSSLPYIPGSRSRSVPPQPLQKPTTITALPLKFDKSHGWDETDQQDHVPDKDDVVKIDPRAKDDSCNISFSTIALPTPFIITHSLVSPQSGSKRSKIPSIPPMTRIHQDNVFGTLGSGGLRGIPGGSVGGTSTIRPLRLSPMSGETTIKPNSYARHLTEYEQILHGLSASHSLDAETAIPPGAFGGRDGPVDEIAVEWCWFCREAKKRQEMELRMIGTKEGGGNGEGLQWVCKRGCEVAKG